MAVNGKVKEKVSTKEAKKINFFRDIKGEVSRITWPSKEDTKKAFLAVLIFTILSMIALSLMDFGFKSFFDWIFNL